MSLNFRNKIVGFVLAAGLLTAQSFTPISAQNQTTILPDGSVALARYLDPINGLTADEAVRVALENNGELVAARKEIEAARALVKQAKLRANPSVEFKRKFDGD